jgi:protease YdgD
MAAGIGRTGEWRLRAIFGLSAFLLGLPAAGSAAAAGPPRAYAPAMAGFVRPVAVFGRDDRTTLPRRLAGVASRVGVLFNNPARTVCSAFCVAPGVIATAAHCVAATSPQGTRLRAADFFFARAYDRERDYARIEGFSIGSAAQHIYTGDFRLHVRPPIDAARDWALVRLERPVCDGGLRVRPTSSDDILAMAAAGRLFSVSYHRDLPNWRPTHAGPCHAARDFEASKWQSIAPDFESPDEIILHTCDTGGGSSGSPILADTPEGPVVVAINVGTYVQSRVIAQRGKAAPRQQTETIANTAVNARVFADQIALFETADILRAGNPIRQLQEHLAALGYYDGRADGDYGPLLKGAIVAYERARGRPVTGLATMPLLAQVVAEATTRHRPTSAPLR